VKLTNDPADRRDLPVASARSWIARLLDHPSPQSRLDIMLDGEFRIAQQEHPELKTKAQFLALQKDPDVPTLLRVVRDGIAERDMGAMSLAAHLYQFQHGRWPANIKELATELPAVPLDPFGDGKQTLGYVLVRHGLPDGGDRPLVYSRFGAKDGLFYRLDVPEYDVYHGDGSSTPHKQQKQGGQFRDVARWVPAATSAGAGPTTRPLVP
ncbi:MAG TPA: hypothetical protein VHY37_12255, partial [Tepidisphaeraceae bacterium]|jgi:hypothetical protein|nr:hypothetical protein [Tepidisphaeraceae bacterium]